MPRKSVKTAVEIFNVLKSKHIFFEDGTLKKEKYVDKGGVNVWSDASQLLLPMSAHLIYIMVHENRKNLKTDLKNYFFPKPVSEVQKSEARCDSVSKNNDRAVENCKEASVELTSDVWDESDSLMRMKLDVLYHSTLQEICLRPLSVTLKSPDHRDTFKALVDADYSIGITILEAVAPNTKMKKYKTSNSHVISVVSKVEDHVVILCQIVSEKVKCSAIQFLLLRILKDEVMKLPSEFFVPYHEGILNNVCKALNTCTMDEYSTHCVDYLQNRRNALPPVMLHIDLMSILTRVADSEYFDNLLPEVKKFYIKCIIYLKLVKNLEEFSSTVVSMFTCLFSLYDDENVDKQKQILDKKLENNEVLETYNKFLQYKRNHSNNLDMFKHEKIEKFKVLAYVEDLKAKTCVLSIPGLPNTFGCSNWYDGQLKFLLSSFTAWTAILLDNSDTDFVFYASNKQKELLSNNPSFVEFLSTTIMQSRESMRTGMSILNNRNMKKLNQKSKTKHTNNQQIFHKCEKNWGGKNNCYKAAKDLIREVTKDDTPESNVRDTNLLKTGKPLNSSEQSIIDTLPTTKSLSLNPELTGTNVIQGDNITGVEQLHTCDPMDDFDFSIQSLDIVMVPNEWNKNIDDNLPVKQNDLNLNTEDLVCTQDGISSFCEESDDCFVPSAHSSLVNSEKLSHCLNDSLRDHNYAFIADTSSLMISEIISDADSSSQIKENLTVEMKADEQVVDSNSPSTNNVIIIDILTETKESRSTRMKESTAETNATSSIKFAENTSAAANNRRDNVHLNLLTQMKENPASEHSENSDVVKANAASTNNLTENFKSSFNTRTKINEKTEASQGKKYRPPSPHRPEMVNVSKKGSKYIRAAPTMELTHTQSAANKNEDTIIRNSTCLVGRKISSVRYTIEDTSKFDVFAEIFSFGYKNYVSFKEACVKICFESCKSNSCLLKISNQYYVDGSVTNFYQNRAEFLEKYANADSDTCVIKIDEGISEFLKTIMRSHFSFVMHRYCTICDRVTFVMHQKIATITMPSPQKLNDLESLLNSYLESQWDQNKYLCDCPSSSKDNMCVRYFWEPYLCIDFGKSDVHDFVNAAPQFICVPNDVEQKVIKYALAGVVTPSTIKGSMYMAYCQTLKKFWDERNGIRKKIRYVSQLPKTKIVLLVYVKVTE